MGGVIGAFAPGTSGTAFCFAWLKTVHGGPETTALGGGGFIAIVFGADPSDWLEDFAVAGEGGIALGSIFFCLASGPSGRCGFLRSCFASFFTALSLALSDMASAGSPKGH